MKKLFILFIFAVSLTLLIFPTSISASVTTTYSSNWAGYVATTSTSTPFTSVSATWKVPKVSDTPSPAFSSAWVGIGGAYRNSSKLIQAGTEQDVASDGSVTYSAWYEIYPQFPVTVGTVNAGDTIFVSISKLPGKPPATWNITMKDGTTTLLDMNFKVNPNFASTVSAEFIVERPLLVVGHQVAPLADFGKVTFSGCSTNLGGLGSLKSREVFMTRDGTATGTPLASPGNLSGNTFSVSYGQ